MEIEENKNTGSKINNTKKEKSLYENLGNHLIKQPFWVHSYEHRNLKIKNE